MGRYDFMIDTYDTERLKTVSIWSEFRDDEMEFRPAALARTPHEHMVHQCISEHNWMLNMLGIDAGQPQLPAHETRLEFIRHYANVTGMRVRLLREKPEEWFDEQTAFFDVPRSRAWVFLRRLTHSAHHRAQLTIYLRLLQRPLFSTYGPTADTGGLPVNKAKTIYRYGSIDELLENEAAGGTWPDLPGSGASSPTERPAK